MIKSSIDQNNYPRDNFLSLSGRIQILKFPILNTMIITDLALYMLLLMKYLSDIASLS